MLCVTKLSQHAVSQSEARKVRHTTPACGNLDKLSQHAVSQSEAREVRHAIPACNRNQSQVGKARHTIPACTAKSKLYKRGCKNAEQQTSWHSEIAVQLEEPEQEEQQTKQLPHLRKLDKRYKATDCISSAGNYKTNKLSVTGTSTLLLLLHYRGRT